MEKDLEENHLFPTTDKVKTSCPPTGVQKKARGIFINSTVLGGDTAKILRDEFDNDGDNHISAEELASLTAAALDSRKENKFLKRAVIGSLVGIVLLLCSTFASSWLAVSLSRKLDTSDKTGDLLNDKTGETVSTRPRNDVVQVNVNPEIARRKLIHDRTAGHPPTQEETNDLVRFLQETPEFTVEAKTVHDLWKKNNGGTLGELGVSVTDSQGSDTLAYVNRNSITRTLVPPDNTTIRYEPLSLVGTDDIRYYLACPAGDVGECKGFGLSNTTDAVRRLENKPTCSVAPCKCFSSESTAELRDGNLVKMKDLKIGDVVQVGHNKYQPVYIFGHKNDHEDTEFIQIRSTASSKTLELSSNHMLFRHGEKTPVPASNINVGDFLMGSKNSQNTEQVIEVSVVRRRGLYAPLTPDGTIVVNGIKASNYVSFQAAKEYVEIGGFKIISWHLMSHMWAYPLHTFCTIISPSMCKNGVYYDEHGFHWWTKLGITLTNLLQKPIWVQMIIIPLVVVPLTAVVFGGCIIIERTWALVVLFGLFLAFKSFKKPIGAKGKIKEA